MENPATERLAQFVESSTDINHEVLELVKALNYGLRFRPTELIKRYLGNNLSVALELLLEIDGRGSKYSALILNGPLHDVHRDLNCRGADHDYKLSVLVDNVRLVNYEHHRVDGIGAVIWLKPFDEITDCRLSDSLYFSLVTGEKLFLRWPRLKDGKLNPFQVGLPITGIGELPDDVIENRPQLVNDLSRQHTKAQGDGAISMVLDCLQKKLVVLIAEDGILAFLEKPINLGLQIKDVLLGPI